MRIELDLGPVEADALIRQSIDEWRPIPMQAEVLLRRALGLGTSPAETPELPLEAVLEANSTAEPGS